MKDERIRILKMVEEGKISADEAAKLLEALENGNAREVADVGGKVSRKRRKMLRLRVYEGNFEKPKVNLALPLGLLKFVSKVMPKDARTQLEEKDIDLDGILAGIDEASGGTILDVHDDEDKVHVEIVVE